jgi:hypothetical protein
MYRKFDTSKHQAVWVPDKCALEEILRRAPIYDHAYIEPTSWILGTGKKYLLHLCDKERDDIFSDNWTELWDKAVEIANRAFVTGASPKFNGRRMAAIEICTQALDMYNAWSSGSVYEVVVQVHDFDGTQLSCDYVDYCYGSDKAEKSLEEAMK